MHVVVAGGGVRVLGTAPRRFPVVKSRNRRMVGVGVGALVAGVFILLLREYTSMNVDTRTTFEGRLNLVSMSVCRSVVGGPLEMFLFPEWAAWVSLCCVYISCCQLPEDARMVCIRFSVVAVLMYAHVCGASCLAYF